MSQYLLIVYHSFLALLKAFTSTVHINIQVLFDLDLLILHLLIGFK